MHELSIACSLVELACEKAQTLGAVRVDALHVRLGALSGVVRDALLFSFDLAAAGTPIEGARLVVEDVPVTVLCPRCDVPRALPEPLRRRCPVCDEPAGRVVAGTELELAALEVTDAMEVTARAAENR